MVFRVNRVWGSRGIKNKRNGYEKVRLKPYVPLKKMVIQCFVFVQDVCVITNHLKCLNVFVNESGYVEKERSPSCSCWQK